jgi:hypothetical protein
LVTASCERPRKADVTRIGELEKLIREGDLSTRIRLQDLQDRSDLYGIGYVTNLQGNITILNGRVYTSYVDSKRVKIDTSYAVDATLLLYVKVVRWREFPVPADVTTWKQLEQFVSDKALKYNVSKKDAFPFMLKGITAEAAWQVQDWNPESKNITYGKILQKGQKGVLFNEPIEAIGFFSRESGEVFAHQETITMFFVNHDHSLAGRLQDIKLDGRMSFLLPLEQE